MRKLFLLFVIASLSQFVQAQNNGNLFIIGGGERSDALMKQMLQTANLQSTDYIIVLPMASAIPDSGFKTLSGQMKKLGKHDIKNFNFSKHNVNDKKWLDSLLGAKLIFITGGDQNRFMKVVLNTPVYSAIHKAYQNGATIAGTSAGAAVMSKHMITGKQLMDTVYKETFNKLWTGNIEFEEGMGLLENVIIDQHFIKRSRYNRLISALSAYPSYNCIGIDEGTAIIVHNKNITVTGVSQVLRISEPKNLKVKGKHLIRLDDLHFSLYASGDKFTIK